MIFRKERKYPKSVQFWECDIQNSTLAASPDNFEYFKNNRSLLDNLEQLAMPENSCQLLEYEVPQQDCPIDLFKKIRVQEDQKEYARAMPPIQVDSLSYQNHFELMSPIQCYTEYIPQVR